VSTISSRYEIPAATHQPGQTVHGFRVDAVTPLEDIRARAYECTHLASGARLLHVHCHDEENLYAIAFRTPPPDSTGVAHITEHSVLAGSRKYPVKDAFNELSKSTLKTFLNAMTWPDKTVYPVCSAVRADYFNLAAVYTDLVLHPLVSEETFRQEGHHLELADLDDPKTDLTVSGVVYNEMKGAYSSPDRVVGKVIQEAIYPDNCYAIDSGGDPDVIPTLTYEKFRAFHRAYYSPSNARWYLYGDIALADHLAFIGERLVGFDRVEVSSEVMPQPRWDRPRSVRASYPIAPGEDTKGKTYVQVSWMLESMAKTEQVVLFEILKEALLGTAASPLRKALVDSGLGQDLSPLSGHDTDFLQTLFTAGLRGSEPERAEQLERLVLETLGRLSREGLDAGLVEAAFHQIEFKGKEVVPPFPVMLLIRSAGPANYGADPKSGLQFGRIVAGLRARYAQDPGLFQRVIQEWFLDNPHRVLSVVAPSGTLAAEKESALKARLAARKQRMSADEVEQVRADAKTLKLTQGTPDPPEALATLPRLNMSDVPRRVRTIPTETREARGVTVFEHPVFSNGVAYVHLAFDLSDLDHETASWAPVLGDATTGLGAAGLDYAGMATRIARSTGGIGCDLITGKSVRSGRTFQRLVIHGRALKSNLGELTAILRDLLTASDTSDRRRVHDIVHEARNDRFASVIPQGNLFALFRAAASFDLARYRQEQWLGSSQVRFLSGLAKESDVEVTRIAEAIASLQRRVFTRGRLLAGVAGDPDLVQAIRAPLDSLIGALPEGTAGAPVEGLPDTPPAVGVGISARVNYVGRALRVPDLLAVEAPAIELLATVLSSDYLYKKLRVQGGAYGGHAVYRYYDGVLGFMSYRDPHLVETLDVYRGVGDFVRSGAITTDLLDRARIGAIGNFDRILSPKEQGLLGMRLRLLEVSDADRLRFRNGLFEVNTDRIRDQALPAIEAASARAGSSVLAPKTAIEEANTKVEPRFALTALE